MLSREARRLKKKNSEETPKTPQPHQRRPLLYIFSIAILVIIVVTFIGGPLVGQMSGRSTIVFGKYANREIRFVPGNYLARQRDLLYDQIRGNTVSDDFQYQAYQVWRGAFDRTVIRTAFLAEAERSGVHVSDNRIDEALLQAGPYSENGQFSETRYTNTPASERQRWRSLFHDEIIHRQYVEDVFHTGFESSSAKDFLKDMAAEERRFRFVVFPYEAFPRDQIIEFGRNNDELFRQINLSRITIRSSQAEAEAVRSRIVDGTATFEDQARNFSVDSFAERGGDMGWRTYYNLLPNFPSPELLDELFRLDQGEISPIIETSFGFTFYRIEGTPIQPDFDDEATVLDVWTYITRFARGMVEDILLSMANQFRADADSVGFETAAEETDLTVYETGYFPVNYGNEFFLGTVTVEGPDAPSLQEAANDESFYRSLFSLEPEDVSPPVVLDEKISVFQLVDIRETPPEDLILIDSYYSYIRQQYLDRDLNEFVFSSPKLVDNFTEVFSELFLQQ